MVDVVFCADDLKAGALRSLHLLSLASQLHAV